MTVIAALVDHDRVWMAADTASYDGRNVLYHHPGKISDVLFGDGERLLIATTGSAALGALDVLADYDGSPDEKVQRAVLAACRWEGGCRPPVDVASTNPGDSE